MKEKLKVFSNGLLKENPSLRLVLGTCPTLAVTTLAVNGLGMGLAATFVLVCSNIAISARPRMMQFTTMSGRKMPSAESSAGTNAFTSICSTVTNVAMTVM